MLWLALYFPLLPLEAQRSRSTPSAVVSGGRIFCCDPAAAAAGVQPGLRLTTARGLLPTLVVHERDEAGERRALDDLACWAGRFTPTLSLVPATGLLLEVEACLRLFGGLDAILSAIEEGARGQSYSICWAVAPTPLAAVWLARAGRSEKLQSIPAMHAALDLLPCSLPGWPAEIVARLEAFGLHCLGDLRRLPTAALRRRVGPVVLDDLARARGALADPRPCFVFPEIFRRHIELPARIEQAAALVFAGQRLFAALAGWLRARQLAIRACTLLITHEDAAQSSLVLRFAEPVADEARFTRLLRERLERLHLRGPVEALGIVADEVLPWHGESAGLFDRAMPGEGLTVCLERLQARLGGAAVRVLAATQDYRPECAVRTLAPGPSKGGGAIPDAFAAPRPLWLLAQPEALPERHGRPLWRGPLELLSRAERVESGWWDEGESDALGDVRRDYFVARNQYGQWGWVFRDAQGWFLHGLFA